MRYSVDRRKVTDYLLNDDHPTGRAKSAFFRSRGFSSDDWIVLRDALLRHPAVALLADVDMQSSFGPKQVFKCTLPTPDGSNPCILSVWQERSGLWHLVTAYPFL